MRSRHSPCVTLVAAGLMVLVSALPAFAGNWGENWGEMTWGELIAAVPLTGRLGFFALVFGLLCVVLWTFRKRARTGALLLFWIMSIPDLAEAQVTVPNTFTDGTPALASEVNENFETLAAALSFPDCATADDVVCNPVLSCPTCPTCPAIPACDTLGSYNLGYQDGGGSVDVTSDNAAVAAAAGSAACGQAGGTWDAGSNTCTPASNYNCFVGGFCSQAAANYPLGQLGYANVYEGDTQGTAPASEADCDAGAGASAWAAGEALSGSSTVWPPSYPVAYLAMCE